jgi:hypothetical protein
MWTELPKPLLDGTIVATSLALALATILSLVGSGSVIGSTDKCQEVVVSIARNGTTLAQCPPETYIELVDDNVILCRCGQRKDAATVEIGPDLIEPSPSTETPNTEPQSTFDDHGHEISL